MSLRGLTKKLLFGSLPALRGRFTYYSHTVHFPSGSHIFERACAEGIYEQDIINLILSLVEPGTHYFDVGANIGLLSVPVLASRPRVKVVSIEASPATLPFLYKTHASAVRREDWTIIGAAIAAEIGEAEFWSGGGARGAFDGLRDTGRGGPKHSVRVPVRTLDDIWHECGCPSVSVIKIDIEGGEYLALQGAKEVISCTKPVLFVEWTDKNLRAHGVESHDLLHLCAEMDYAVHLVPGLARIDTKLMLCMAMAQTEAFVLVPLQRCEHSLSKIRTGRQISQVL
jgi:FkbM family methyltransferase